jgi:hypothetical protein
MISRAALILAAGCVALGALVAAEITHSDIGDRAAGISPPRTAETAAAAQEHPVAPERLLAVSLSRPLFDPRRRPPQAGKDAGAAEAQLAGARLTGILTAPDNRLAIFAVTGGKPVALSEGQSVDGWRIETITPHDISLVGPGGLKTLTPKRDPKLAGTSTAPIPQPEPAVPANAPEPLHLHGPGRGSQSR